ncbi:ER membrane chaperone for multipass membrane proteins, PAT complex subunit (asterix), Pat10 [Schizosaccharomyces pombe]|uniref:Uncharacterized protein C18B11.08c n=1 Tax=Schizosaccharomyces pombe (strain 972 / ATCC 24843) TaxID=284812 RepID=YA38_SCHPO|nr:uncharacterized protein SPAC18B11.08c [Schizosaccharomyces pombe]Q09714.2 RecName: Full=Uncharacterized protein C18B11.08c [Schizosaccharomyces pombe 972h-]CAA90596.2 conserved fungal protein [Schizosaccharomyces pombe]|eukprot:NP_592875.1 uncharacterized protein SPAC18B11.08c [Schizosaccharomyces pombe]
MAPAELKRPDLIVPYKARVKANEEVGLSLVSTATCMAALFLRFKLIAWVAFILTFSNLLNANTSPSSSPTSMAFMGIAALVSTYLPQFLNTPNKT